MLQHSHLLPVEEVGRVVGRIHTAASCFLQLVSALPLLALRYPLKKALYIAKPHSDP